MKKWLASAVVLILGRGRRRPRIGGRERIVEPGFPNRRAELLAVVLFLCAAACGVAFPVVYAVNAIPRKTQFLGIALGLCFGFVAAACVVIAKRLVASEELEDDYSVPEHPEEQERIEQIVEESGERITRKRLFVVAGGAAGAALGVALITPAASLGPVFDINPFFETPWRRGVRLVDELGNVFHPGDVEEGSFYTAFPQHADREQMGAALVVVRLPPAELSLPPDRNGWAPGGILAYSKICTHAGCAINLYRKAGFEQTRTR